MAEPIDFPERTHILGKPENMSDEECCPLPCHISECLVVSKWKLTEKEIENVKKNGYVWLGVHSHGTQPPVWISGEETVFTGENDG